jgi:hypothetical protein
LSDGLLDQAVRVFAAKVAAGDLQSAADCVEIAARLAGVEPGWDRVRTPDDGDA